MNISVWGVCNVFLAFVPLAGKRIVKITERRTKQDWSYFPEDIVYEHTNRITLVMDNLNTHDAGSLYETFVPDKAKEILDKFEFVYTPKHGSCLNMAEIELVIETICTIGGGLFKSLQKVPPIFKNQRLTLSKSSISQH